jgi:hypothetical protein
LEPGEPTLEGVTGETHCGFSSLLSRTGPTDGQVLQIGKSYKWESASSVQGSAQGSASPIQTLKT